MNISVEAILPSGPLFSDRQIKQAIDNALEETIKAIQVDFNVTTQTFKHGVGFAITRGADWRQVATDDEIYGFLNYGTRVRYATMTPDFQAKTTPRIIASRSGSGGVMYVRKDRPRPGIKAREFDKTIAAKWAKEFPAQMNRALASELL